MVARVTAQWRDAYRVLALQHRAELAAMGPVRITVVPYLRDGRGRQDVAGCAGAAKAAIDGVADAVWGGRDDPAIVTALTFLPPVRGQGDGLELRIERAHRPVGGPLAGPGLLLR